MMARLEPGVSDAGFDGRLWPTLVGRMTASAAWGEARRTPSALATVSNRRSRTAGLWARGYLPD